MTLEAILIPLLIFSTAMRPTSVVSRLLECGILRWIGRLSYSLYVWHMLFFVARFWIPNLVQSEPLNILALVVCALTSYYFVERPALRWGKCLESRRLKKPPDSVTASSS